MWTVTIRSRTPELFWVRRWGRRWGQVRHHPLRQRFIPMDEALAFCSLDISNRPFLVFQGTFTNAMIGQYDACLTEEFFRAFAFNAGITLHVNMMYGVNDHHNAKPHSKPWRTH